MKKMIAAIVLTTLAVGGNAVAGHGKQENIVATAAAAGQFETLIAAAKAAGLADALTGDGPLTVFAPTDDAFGALPAGTIDSLLKPENKEQLATILKYHVVAGRIGSDALANGATLETLAGQRITFTATEGGFAVDNARIVATDVSASNGIIHVIDRVILPAERMSRAAAFERIERAIERGVPLFNHGNARATAELYEATAESLIDGAALTQAERMRLERGVRAAASAGSARESAWQLRYALDDVGDTLSARGEALMTRR